MIHKVNLINCHNTTISNSRIEAGKGEGCLNLVNSGTIMIHGSILVNKPINVGNGVTIHGKN